MLRLTQTRTRKLYPLTKIVVLSREFSFPGLANYTGTRDALYRANVVI